MRRVFIGQPYDHHIDRRSERAAKNASARKESVFIRRWEVHESCLVARSFNTCLALCLAEGGFDYFCLLHADVAPQFGFVDVLLDEMDASGADIIHAPAAIKNPNGATTTAIAYSDDEWEPVRRITTTELQKLPQTFDIETLRECYDPLALRLLPNTGCMLIKLGEWIDDFPGFEVRDRLGTVSGVRVPQSVTEDWNFGHWADRNGLQVAGTRAVVTEHWGPAPYPSNQAWGAPVDEDWLKARELAVA